MSRVQQITRHVPCLNYLIVLRACKVLVSLARVDFTGMTSRDEKWWKENR